MKIPLQKLWKGIVLFSFLLTLQVAKAQAPQKMSYQSVIRNASNALITNTVVGIKISVLQNTATGTAVYVERQTPTTNLNGLASIEIGGGTLISGNFATINWANGPYFIKTETDPSGGTSYTISGTSQLLSVPFALFAASGTPGPQGLQGLTGAAGTNGTNGAQGIQGLIGAPGIAGTNGKNTLILTTTEPMSANCATGGVKHQYGIDTNNNGTLDVAEINASLTKYVCNGATGSVANVWGLTGNTSTDAINNFIGTTDAKPLVFRVQNTYAGRIGNDGMVAIGTGAAAALSDASIVAIGKDALLNNGTGATGIEAKNNTAIGSAALTTNTKGYFNTATGFEALKANTIGNYNTANGVQALLNNTDGGFNTATGNQALFTNTIGDHNTAYGNGALYKNVAGNYNTAIGDNALLSTINSANTAVGSWALKANTTGSGNVALGSDALLNNVSGFSNTAVGANSLLANETGTNNTAIGRLADVTAANLTNATAIGAFAKVGSSNSLVLGASENAAVPNVKVGIGIQNPQNTLHVNPEGVGGIFIGKSKTSGGYTGLEMGVTNLSGGGAFVQAIQLAGSLYGDLLLNPNGGQVGIGYSNPTSVQFPLDINQTDEKGIRLANGSFKWGIGVSGGPLDLSYNGDFKGLFSTIDGSYNNTSDARLKKDINKMTSVLDKVMALQPKTYKYISSKETDRRSSGFLAQEVIPLFPELVSDFKNPTKDSTDNTVYHGINYAGFGVVAIKAIQEQQQQIEALKTDNKAILSQMDLLKAENKLMLQQMEKMQVAIDAISKK